MSAQELINRLYYVIDPSASATERVARRSHLTNHDIRQCIAALETASGPTPVHGEGLKEAVALEVRRAMQSEFLDGKAWDAAQSRVRNRTDRAKEAATAILALATRSGDPA